MSKHVSRVSKHVSRVSKHVSRVSKHVSRVSKHVSRVNRREFTYFVFLIFLHRFQGWSSKLVECAARPPMLPLSLLHL